MTEAAQLLQQAKNLLTQATNGAYVLDARGYTCPYPQLFARAAFGLVEKGIRLEILTDNPSSCENVPVSVRNLGQKFVGVESVSPGLWRIVVQKVR